jgi:BACON domain-containing protein/all-beta uncharacterized protein
MHRSRRIAPGAAAPLLAAAFLFTASPAVAQTTMDPTRAEFSPSADHDATAPDGSAVVTSYRLDLFLSGAAQPFQSTSLGKPVPDGDGIIRVDLTSILVGWPVAGTVYAADVAAVGPGGSAASAMSNPFSFSGLCAYSVSPTTASAVVTGGPGTINVNTAAACAWTASANASWISITGGSTGLGNGAVTYAVAANGGTSARTGTLTVAGRTVTITQNGSCSYSVSPTSQSFGAGGGANSLAVTAAGGCAWTAASNASWISVTGGASGSGNGTVNYAVTSNSSSSARTGTLTVAGRTVTITENGSCSYTISPTSRTLASGGGSGSVSVTSTSGCAWTASSSASWLQITSGSNGSGSGTVNYTASANTGSASRTGTLTVAGRTFTLTESAPCTFTVAPTSQSFGAAGGTSSVAVTAASGCSWTATSNASWITITSGGSGSGNGTVSYRITSNGGSSSRTGTLTVAGRTVTVNEASTTSNVPSAPTNVRIKG